MRIATGMSLTPNGTGFCMAPEHKMTGLFCNLRNQVDDVCLRVSSDSNGKRPSLSIEDKSYPANSFLLFANVVVFWLFLVASSYFLLSKSVNTFGGCREKHAKNVSSSDSTISNASIENDANAANHMLSCSESSGCSYRISYSNSYTELCSKCDAHFQISDLDKASYMNSLLSLEDDDSEWLSDSMPCGSSSEEPSTPLSYKCDAYYEISDFEQGSYLHSLLSLDDEDSEWLSDSKSIVRSSEELSTPLSYKSDAYYEISDFEKASYLHSLLCLEDEDSEWLSDSKSFGCSSENPSTPLSYKFDIASEISDLDKAVYMHSLFNLEDERSEGLSDSKSIECSPENTPFSYKIDLTSEWLPDLKPYACSSENLSTPLSYKSNTFSEISDLDKASYVHSLLNLEGEDSEWLSDSKSFDCSSENPSTPLRYKSEISDLDKAGSLHSLLSLEDDDSEWLSDSKPYACSSENLSTPLSYRSNVFSEISDLDKASYMHSLLNLEDEDSEWLSDSKSFGCSSENPSTPLSYKFDAASDISDLNKECSSHSLLNLENENSHRLLDCKSYYGCSSENSTPLSSKCDSYYEISNLDKASFLQAFLILEDDCEWLSDSTSWDIVVPPSVSTGSFTVVNFGNSEDNISVENLLETAGVEEEFSADEPLFWPLEGKLNWKSEEPWSSFCTSPRRFSLNSRPTTSKIKECNKQKGDETPCRVNCEISRLSMWPKSSAKIVPLECKDLESPKDLLLGKVYFALDQDLPVETFVGLKEFDGHEGFDSEFNDVFILDE